ncbi:MAG: 2Fe-2S iron-sulfur cluster-binding protein [Fimbriimonas sp.]
MLESQTSTSDFPYYLEAVAREFDLDTDEVETLRGLSEPTRREFLGFAAAAGLGSLVGGRPPERMAALEAWIRNATSKVTAEASMTVNLTVNGARKTVGVDPRTVLLDALRERMGLTGTKKGCDHGQCGACTVLVDGRRVLSCLTLAAQAEGKAITTIEGLADGDDLHPLQEAFIKHDAFQCGYCTPGQICSAVGMLEEAKRGAASHVSGDVRRKVTKLSDDEIRERMSGNICRCGAYPKIVSAIQEVHSGKEARPTWAFHVDEEEVTG